MSPLGDVDHAVDHPHRGGLAAAGRADEHADLAGGDLERERVDGGRVGAGVAAWSRRRTPARPPRGSRTAPRTGRWWIWSRGSPGEGAADATHGLMAFPVRARRRGARPRAPRPRACRRAVPARRVAVQRRGGEPVGEPGVLGQQRAVQVGADDRAVRPPRTPSKPERPSLPWPRRTRPSGARAAPSRVRPPWFSKPASTCGAPSEVDLDGDVADQPRAVLAHGLEVDEADAGEPLAVRARRRGRAAGSRRRRRRSPCRAPPRRAARRA